MSTATTLPTSSEEPDSRTSSVGRKRGFNELSTAIDSIITIEDDSSDEDNQPREKRSRYSEGVEAENQQPNSTAGSSPDVVIIGDSSESVSSPEQDGSTISVEAVLADSSGNFEVGNAVDPPPAWNPGVSATIRISLTDRTPQAQLLSTHAGIAPPTSVVRGAETAAASVNASTRVAVEQSLDGNCFAKGAATTVPSEESVDIPSILELQEEPERLRKIEKEHAKKMPRGQKEAPRSLQEVAEKEEIQSIMQAEARDKKRANILAHLPSSFGGPFWQKEAEKIINGLPEDNKDLMPRDVADAALNLTVVGRSFKLPQRLHDALPVVHLAKLSFRHPVYSFVGAFLEENKSMLKFIDYKLLVRAFQEYVRLLYGHLPDSLTSLVCSSKHVVGPKSKKACLNIISETRERGSRKRELEETKWTENDADKAELRRIQAELVEEGKALISVKDLDKEAGAETKQKAQRGGRRGAKLAKEAENGNGPRDLEKYRASKQSESENLEPDSAEDLTTVFDSRSYKIGQNSQDPKPHSMGRLLGAKRAQSQALRLAIADSTNDNKEKLSGERALTHNQQAVLETVSGPVHTSDQVDAEQKPANNHSSSLELIHRYLPPSVGSHIFHYCLTCAQTDHEASKCPLLTCASCGLRGIHFTDVCPKRQRCAKCHERGHQKFECPEKLAATADESIHCDTCSSSNHLESGCHFLWRSFKPGMLKTTIFVADIPVHCYCCGATGHFGSECGIRSSPLHTDGYSWSMSNWKRYVDPRSLNHALSIGKDFSLPVSTKGKKSFNIRGSAQSGIVTLMDGDENIPFIREKVVKTSRPVQRGNQHIRFDHSRPEDKEYLPHSDLGPPLPDSPYQPPRVVRPVPQQKAYTEDRHEFSRRPRDDSARYMRERSFSPPPRFHDERYLPKPRDGYHRTDETFDSYRPYGRGIGSSSDSSRAQVGRSNYNQALVREGPAQGGYGEAAVPRSKRQRNRKG